MSVPSIVLTSFAALFGVLTLFFVTVYVRTEVREVCARIEDGNEDKKLVARREYSKRRPRAVKILSRAAYIIVLAAVLCCAISSVVFSLSGGRQYAGVAPLAVASGSMSYVNSANDIPQDAAPGFNALDLIFISHVQPRELNLYDIVAYRSVGGEIIIHRIVQFVEMGGQNYYVLQGDANAVPDGAIVSAEAIIGIYRGFKIPYLGAVVLFFQSWIGMVTLAVVAYIVCLYAISSKKIGVAARRRLAVLDE